MSEISDRAYSFVADNTAREIGAMSNAKREKEHARPLDLSPIQITNRIVRKGNVREVCDETSNDIHFHEYGMALVEIALGQPNPHR